LGKDPEQIAPDATTVVRLDFVSAIDPLRLGGPEGRSDLEVVQGTPPASPVSVRACNRPDAFCAEPVVVRTGKQASKGPMMLDIRGGFAGFFEVQAEGYIPSLFYGGTFLSGQTQVRYPVIMVPNLAVEPWAGLVGTALDPKRGHLIFFAYDCADVLARGVEARIDIADGGTAAWYIQELLPDANATATDVAGSGGFFNLPVAASGPGAATLSLRDRGTRQELGSYRIFIRPGHFTTVHARPRAWR
jgi:hypothetical protein